MVLGRLFKSSKKRKEDLKVKGLKKTASTTVRGRSANKKKSDAKRELARLQPKEEKAPRKTGRGQGNRSVAGNPNRGGGKTSTTSTKSTRPKKKMSRLEAENRKRFGDAHVDKLIANQKAFKANRKKKK
tara:strand:- start:62 stop:448 length:387 start_codon:yes stop_codon:yes gene_type:complete